MTKGIQLPKVRWHEYKRNSQQREWMGPKQFLGLVAPPMFGTKKSPFAFSKYSLKGLEKAFKQKEKLYSLRLDVRSNGLVVGHEGRHRAYYALKKGWKKLPVVIWHEDVEGHLILVTKHFDVKKLKPQKCYGLTAMDIVKTKRREKR